MASSRLVNGLLIAVAVLLLVLAVVYFVEPASSLPSFIPGHEAGSSHHHVKHGIAALVVAAGLLVLVWFRTGPKHKEAA